MRIAHTPLPIPTYVDRPLYRVADCFGETYMLPGTLNQAQQYAGAWEDSDPESYATMGICVIPASSVWSVERSCWI